MVHDFHLTTPRVLTSTSLLAPLTGARVPAEARSHARQNDVRYVVQLAGTIEQGVLEERLLRARAAPHPRSIPARHVEQVRQDAGARVAHHGQQAEGQRFGARGDATGSHQRQSRLQGAGRLT